MPRLRAPVRSPKGGPLNSAPTVLNSSCSSILRIRSLRSLTIIWKILLTLDLDFSTFIAMDLSAPDHDSSLSRDLDGHVLVVLVTQATCCSSCCGFLIIALIPTLTAPAATSMSSLLSLQGLRCKRYRWPTYIFLVCCGLVKFVFICRCGCWQWRFIIATSPPATVRSFNSYTLIPSGKVV